MHVTHDENTVNVIRTLGNFVDPTVTNNNCACKLRQYAVVLKKKYFANSVLGGEDKGQKPQIKFAQMRSIKNSNCLQVNVKQLRSYYKPLRISIQNLPEHLDHFPCYELLLLLKSFSLSLLHVHWMLLLRIHLHILHSQPMVHHQHDLSTSQVFHLKQ